MRQHALFCCLPHVYMAASLACIPLDGEIGRRLQLQFREQGSRQVLPLNTENVASVFQIVPLNKMYGVFSFGDRLEIPDELQSQPLKAAGWYVDEGKRFGWRWIVVSLDLCNETNVSDYLLPYVESPADPSLTVERVKPIMMELTDWTEPGPFIIVPRARAAIIRQQHESEDEQRAHASIYYVHIHPFSSWHHLARIIYRSSQPNAAVDAFRAHLPKPKDPTLTPANVISVMEDVEVWEEFHSSKYLGMPEETHRELLARLGSGRALKIALIEEYLFNHLYPTWEPVKELVEKREEEGKARAGLAQEIEDKYITMSPEEAQAVLDRALESGSLKQRNLIAVITGVMGAGKTCVLRQLFRLKSPDVYNSTGVAESYRGLMHHVAKVGSFKVLSNEEIHELLAPVLSSGMAAGDIYAISKKNEGEICQATEGGKPSLSHPRSFIKASFPPLLPSESHVSLETSPFQSLSLPQDNAHTPPERSCSSEAVSSILQKTSKHSIEQDMILELVHAIDTGGQPEYMETMPCLIHNSNLTLLVLNLEQSLDAFPKVKFHKDGKEFARTFCFRLTKRQIIERLARTMQAKKCKKVGKKGFKLLVICTHRDRLFFPSWALSKVNKELKKIFIPAFKNELIVFQPPNQIAFPLNARSPDNKDQLVLKRIRECVREAGAGNEIDIPPSFLMFEQDTLMCAKKLKRDILTFSECVQVGLLLKMSQKKVKAALIYLHQHNIFLYFPTVLSSLVFTNPQVPLDFVNKVVAFSYQIDSGAHTGLPAEYGISLKNGIISKEMLQKPLSSCYIPGIYEFPQVITLFTHLRVVAAIQEPMSKQSGACVGDDNLSVRTGQKYLMPCMLPVVKNITRFLPLSPASVFVVRFSDDCAPIGVFGGSISTLFSTHGWEICRKEDGSPQCMTHDVVTLHDPELPAQVTFLNATRHYEVRVKAHDYATCADVCPTIRNTICLAIEATLDVMQFDSTIENALVCPCVLSRTLAHAAVPRTVKDNVHLKCSITGSPLGLANDKQTVWLSQVPTPAKVANTVTELSRPLAPATVTRTVKDNVHSECSISGASAGVADNVPTPAKVANTTSVVEEKSPMSSEPLEKEKERLASIEDTPTLPELINFKTQSSSISIIREIGVHYHLLGPVLLKDDNGRVTDAIKSQYNNNAALINQEILKMWLNGTGLQPIKWSTLISALEQIELPTLAKTIADNLQ